MFSYTLRLIQMLHIRRGHLCYIQIQAYNQQFVHYYFLITDYPVTLHRGHGRLNQQSLVNTYFCYRPNICAFKHEYLNTFSQLKGLLFYVWFEWSFQQPEPDETAPTCRQQGATVVSLGCSCAVLHEYCSALLWDFAGYKAKREAPFGLQHTRHAES